MAQSIDYSVCSVHLELSWKLIVWPEPDDLLIYVVSFAA